MRAILGTGRLPLVSFKQPIRRRISITWLKAIDLAQITYERKNRKLYVKHSLDIILHKYKFYIYGKSRYCHRMHFKVFIFLLTRLEGEVWGLICSQPLSRCFHRIYIWGSGTRTQPWFRSRDWSHPLKRLQNVLFRSRTTLFRNTLRTRQGYYPSESISLAV